jgi:hypothetical protein
MTIHFRRKVQRCQEQSLVLKELNFNRENNFLKYVTQISGIKILTLRMRETEQRRNLYKQNASSPEDLFQAVSLGLFLWFITAIWL